MGELNLISAFVARTCESEEIARCYLEKNYWSLSTALTFYMVDKNEGRI